MRGDAIAAVDAALRAFEDATNLAPRVIFIPRRLFSQYEAEQAILKGILPETGSLSPKGEWVEVQMVEHDTEQTIDVY